MRNLSGSAHRAHDLFHHEVAVPPCVILCPFHRLDIVIEVLCMFGKIRQVNVRQVYEELLHVLASDIDEIVTHAIADTARSAMKHEPHSLRFIEAYLDEMVAGSERAEVVRVISTIQLRMLRENRIIPSFQLAQPDASIAFRNVVPCA